MDVKTDTEANLDYDAIEDLVVKSVRLGEEVWERAYALREHRKNTGIQITEEQICELEAMEEESERIWQKAKALGKDGVTQKNYEDLANAIVYRGIRDWEALISGSITPRGDINEGEIRKFMKSQVYSRLDMEEMLDQIKSVYELKFIPYAKRNRSSIIKQWTNFQKKKMSKEDAVFNSKHKCPLCGGSYRPRIFNNAVLIGCTNCDLMC